ncbi:MAG TPA: RNA polymerase sigma factor [Jiangellaceae bacterium]|nr:RNA polymerase sigma factor [Jiangellaceae bacterium]
MSDVHDGPQPVGSATAALSRESPDAAVFRQIFEALYDDLVRFVERRTDPAVVEDVVAESFVVAWRRFAELPSDIADVRPWMFAVARRVLANTYRSQRRARDLTARIAAQPRHDRADDAAAVAHRLDLARAFERLSARDQEVLTLVAWDGLSPSEAAQVLEISASAFSVRLSRARRRLRARLGRVAEEGDRP